MTSARRTPRYVGIIPAAPAGMGPHLMGPQPLERTAPPAPTGGAGAYTPVHGGRRNDSGIIPIHPVRPAPAPAQPLPPVAPLPASPRTRVVPVERRPWRVMIISASPGVAPRSLEVRRWQVRLTLAALGLVSALAFAFVVAVVVAVRQPEILADGLDGQALRLELDAARDSLASMRASVAEAESASESGDADAEPVVAPSRPVVVPKAADHPRPLARTRATVERETEREGGLLSVMPRSLADLPVIGAIASGFSRARRHPILHRVRPHLGVDVAAPRGTRVSAPAAGRVQFVGRKLGFGLVVELDHGHGITTRYAHLRSSAVEVGEVVTKGEAIAAVGTSGITTGPHLHYEVLDHGRQVDPLRFRFGASEPVVPIPAPVATTPVSPVMPAIVQPVAPPAAVGSHDSGSPAPSPR